MRRFTFSLLLLFFSLPIFGAWATKPNIVFVLSDDHTYRDAGAYGNRDVHTPNIDRLAAGGMRFDRAYAAAALCTPTRLAIASGHWPHGHAPNAKERAGHLVGTMKSLGYHTTSVAKTIPGEFDTRIKCGKVTAQPAVDFLAAYDRTAQLFMIFGAEGTRLERPEDEKDRYDPKDFSVVPQPCARCADTRQENYLQPPPRSPLRHSPQRLLQQQPGILCQLCWWRLAHSLYRRVDIKFVSR